MRFENVGGFIGIEERSRTSVDLSDEDETLVYELPESEVVELPPEGAATALQRPARVRASASTSAEPARRPGSRIITTVLAALIGAMAAAWSIEQQAFGQAPSAQDLISAVDELRRVDPGALLAFATSQTIAPARPALAPAPAPRPSALVPAAPVPAEPMQAEPVQAEPVQAEPVTAEPVPAAPAMIEPMKAQPVKAQPAKLQPRSAQRGTRVQPVKAQAVNVRAAAPPVQSGAARTGLLRINSRPWSKVYVDGRPIGSTPQTAIELSPGRHRVKLISEEFDLQRTLTVRVRTGHTVTRSVELLQ